MRMYILCNGKDERAHTPSELICICAFATLQSSIITRVRTRGASEKKKPVDALFALIKAAQRGATSEFSRARVIIIGRAAVHLMKCA